MPKPHTLVVARRPEDSVVSVRIAMRAATLKHLRVEAIERDVTVADLITEALAQRAVNPIAVDGVPEAAFRMKRGGGK